MITTITTAVIAIAVWEALRYLWYHFGVPKKLFFKREQRKILAEIWNQEWGRFNTVYKREKTRQLIDAGHATLDRMKANKKTPKEEIEKVEEQLKNLKHEIDWFDVVINGGKVDTPDGPWEDQGINPRLESLYEKKELTKEFIKQYC